MHLHGCDFFSLLWRHNGRDCVSNHQPHDCLLNRLFGRRSKWTSKLRVTGLCGGNSPGTGEFPAQMASYAENVSIWWHHHVMIKYQRRHNWLTMEEIFLVMVVIRVISVCSIFTSPMCSVARLSWISVRVWPTLRLFKPACNLWISKTLVHTPLSINLRIPRWDETAHKSWI